MIRDAIEIYVADPYELVRAGIDGLLSREQDMAVVGTAGDPEEALMGVRETRPGVVIIDAAVGGGAGVDLCRKVLAAVPGVRCLMMTTYIDDDAMLAAIMAGASGYVLKSVTTHEFVSDIRRIAAGESLLDATATARLLSRIRTGGTEDRLAALSPQERKILGLVSVGMSNREIAEKLHLSEGTVKNYVSRMLHKLGMVRRSQVASFMAQQGRVLSPV